MRVFSHINNSILPFVMQLLVPLTTSHGNIIKMKWFSIWAFAYQTKELKSSSLCPWSRPQVEHKDVALLSFLFALFLFFAFSICAKRLCLYAARQKLCNTNCECLLVALLANCRCRCQCLMAGNVISWLCRRRKCMCVGKF